MHLLFRSIWTTSELNLEGFQSRHDWSRSTPVLCLAPLKMSFGGSFSPLALVVRKTVKTVKLYFFPRTAKSALIGCPWVGRFLWLAAHITWESRSCLWCGLTGSHYVSGPLAQANGIRRPSPLCLMVDTGPKWFSLSHGQVTFPVVVLP